MPRPNIANVADAVNRAGKKLVTKHPALIAGGVGLGLGMDARMEAAPQLERKLMQEMMVGPSPYKYSSCKSMNKFAAQKVVLSSRAPLHKVAFTDSSSWDFSGEAAKSLAGAAGSQVAKESVGGLRRLLGSAFQAVKETFFTEPKRQKLVENIKQMDPNVASMEQEQPGTAQQAYRTMARFAPTLSTDPNLVTSFLRNAAMTGGALDYQMVKGLADAETAVQRAKNEGAWLRGGF